MNDNNINFNVPFYMAYIAPYGYLDASRESHALWNYYTKARATYERLVKDPIVLEGQKDNEPNFQQLFTSIARMYRVEPQAMGKCWDLVDAQCDALQIPRMPDEDRFRFTNRKVIITTVKGH